MARRAKTKPGKAKSATRRPVRAKAAKSATKKSAPKAQKPIELYFWPTANGKKITIMLEECGLPYVIRPIDISTGAQFTPEFLKISPNNRMPAIVDPDGPGGKPISIFESGAILQYLGRKTGKFYPKDERGRVEVDQWVFWQVGGLGPMGGQANHFRNYAPSPIDYAITRYTDEMNRLFGVLNKQLEGRSFITDKYSIADIICYSWVKAYKRFGQELEDFPNIKRWIETLDARPALQRGQNPDMSKYPSHDMHDPKVRAVLFNQRAR